MCSCYDCQCPAAERTVVLRASADIERGIACDAGNNRGENATRIARIIYVVVSQHCMPFTPYSAARIGFGFSKYADQSLRLLGAELPTRYGESQPFKNASD